jgi:hypothetical protein
LRRQADRERLGQVVVHRPAAMASFTSSPSPRLVSMMKPICLVIGVGCARLQQRDPVHARHVQVGQDQVRLAHLQDAQRLLAIGGVEHAA